MKLEVGTKYNVEVIKLLKYGVIVRLEDNSTELIHISNLSDKYVSDTADILSVNQTCEALGIPGKKYPVELSLKKFVDGQRKSNTINEVKYHKSLDEMIEDSNKAYSDKTKSNLKSFTSGKRPRRKSL